MQCICYLSIVLLALHSLCSCYNDHIICVYEQGKENGCQDCTENYTNVSSIKFPDGGNFILQFCFKELKLEGVISIINKQSVLVKGMPTVLKCERNLMERKGLLIKTVIGLVVQDIQLKGCSALHNASQLENGTLSVFKTSMYILNCTNVTVQRVTIANSTGNGLTMFNNDGTVSIENCTFKGNEGNISSTSKEKSGGSGLHVEISYCGPRKFSKNSMCPFEGRNISSSNYYIKDCVFSENKAGYISGPPNIEESETLIQGFGRGGGMCFIIDTSSDNLVEVMNCNFIMNSGIWGGGLYVTVQDDSHSNRVLFRNSNFLENVCDHAGGGVDVEYLFSLTKPATNNSITFESCRFHENKAKFGGGIDILSTPTLNVSNKNHISLKNCNWSRNMAENGAAIDISPHNWLSPSFNPNIQIRFSDCIIEHNYLHDRGGSKKNNASYVTGRGSFSTSGYSLILQGNITFHNNTGTAMFLTNTNIKFEARSNITFDDNSGFDGGAMFLLGSSSLKVQDDSVFRFTNNRAIASGGAIFQCIHDFKYFIYSHRCFIEYEGEKNLNDRNITFIFENNAAGPHGRNSSKSVNLGHSISATTLRPCYKSVIEHECNYSDSFQCIGNFTFVEKNIHDLSTSITETKLIPKNKKRGWIIPGELYQFPIKSVDELAHEVPTVYHVSVDNPNISIDSAYTYTSNKIIKLYGKYGDSAKITFRTIHIREVVFTMVVRIQQCPPGYVHNHEKNKGQCICSATTKGKSSWLQSCNDNNFSAMLYQGYWMGYDREPKNNGFGKEENLLLASCPRGQCKQNVNKTYSLPKTTSIKDLENLICGSSRTGMLCSLCRENFTAHYHNDIYECKETVDDCKWGWLFYILSEIIPVTILFIAILTLNITLTNGAINGFIFFAQISDTMLIRGSGFIQFPTHARYALEGYQLITRVFNLNFFAHNRLSFCLWKSATTLDLIAFKYVTILYALLLVLSIIFITKYCNAEKYLYRILKIVNFNDKTSARGILINGISGFLVLCYSECTRISLMLVTAVRLRTSSVNGVNTRRIVAFYGGEMIFFQGKHLAYALPALLILAAFCIVPPLLLISYPLCYRVFGLLRIGESRVVKLLCTCIPLEKFKPFFDIFQNSYKEEFRFFSGLYFLCRFTTLVTFVFVSEFSVFYIIVQIQFTIILAVHAIASPYKERQHNRLDTLLFLNISTINLISLLNFLHTTNFVDKQLYINIASSIQMVLLYLPLVYITVYASTKMVHKLKNFKRKSTLSDYHEFLISFSHLDAENRMSNEN